jgi:aspartyl-tRNA(Asn)/glutamyl-tRNA(Gln) amidotransferase subunit B
LKYETVIGLEVHVELKTNSKIFCGCSTVFGADPNTQICTVCAGLPGVLPVLNKKAVELAIKAGIITNCTITKRSVFDRKNYFYPDLPKAYQISQLYHPLCTNGHIEIITDDGVKKIRIREIHLEEDAGKLLHDVSGSETMVDFNRCGVPLIEIVTMPDFSSSDEAYGFLQKLKAMIQFADISDCKMQEGSLRADVNVSIREAGSEKLGTRTEMKNLNSFKAIAKAIDAEAARQTGILKNGGKIVQETRRWDDEKNTSYPMRGKEEAHDYRYFPEPDLPVIITDEKWLNKLKSELPEMPDKKSLRYREEFLLSEYDASLLTSSKSLSLFFDAAIESGGDPKIISNWLMGDYMKLFNSSDREEYFFDFRPEELVKLTDMIKDGRITGKIAKEIFAEMFEKGTSPDEIISRRNISVLNDEQDLLDIIKKVLENNPKSVKDILAGKDKAVGFLVGQVMKETKGMAEPNIAKEMIIKILNKEGE